MRAILKLCLLAHVPWFIACGPSLEDHIELLSSSPDQREKAQHELLLAKEHAVEPLLAALGNSRHAAGRVHLADVLVSLMLRVEDPRIEKALQKHLLEDPDAEVRARIAHKLGTQKDRTFAADFFRALKDTSGQVRFHAMAALSLLEDVLDDEQKVRLRQVALDLTEDPYRETRIEAMFVVEGYVAKLVSEAHNQVLKANLNEAEAIFHRALAYSPNSKRGNYYLGRFYLDFDQRDLGLKLMRQHHFLIDAPLLDPAPTIDGHLRSDEWQQATMIETFYQWGHQNSAAYLSQVRTRAYVGYTGDGLYFAAHCHDAHPDSLLVSSTQHDQSDWRQDQVEFFFDTNFDRQTYAHITINSAGAITDIWRTGMWSNRVVSWDADTESAVHVGANFWSVELVLNFGQEHFAHPVPGEIWNLNIQRHHRTEGFSQWMRTYQGGSKPDSFGFLEFH